MSGNCFITDVQINCIDSAFVIGVCCVLCLIKAWRVTHIFIALCERSQRGAKHSASNLKQKTNNKMQNLLWNYTCMRLWCKQTTTKITNYTCRKHVQNLHVSQTISKAPNQIVKAKILSASTYFDPPNGNLILTEKSSPVLKPATSQVLFSRKHRL